MVTFTTAQDGASAPLPSGIDNKAPEPAPAAPVDANSGSNNSSDPTPPSSPDSSPSTSSEGEPEKLNANYTGPRIDNIYPQHGPSSGNTAVVIRGGPLAKYQLENPEPKCKFGDAIVSAPYVPCPPAHLSVYGFEGKHEARTDLCIQCENSPPLEKAENVNVTFTFSMDGHFKDVQDSTWFEYYKPVHVSAIKPVHGPKDGGTTVQVWGTGFVDYGDESTCSFGVKVVKGDVINENYATCVSPASDVVNRPMPFAVSLNGQ